jgi:hypothetical protein
MSKRTESRECPEVSQALPPSLKLNYHCYGKRRRFAKVARATAKTFQSIESNSSKVLDALPRFCITWIGVMEAPDDQACTEPS